MIKNIFKKHSVLSGTITDYNYQTDIADLGWHFVTMRLDNGEEKKVGLQSNSYKPFEIGQRISGKAIPGLNVSEGDVDLSLIDIEEIAPNDSPRLAQWIMRPFRETLEDLARAEARGMRDDIAMGKDPGTPFFGRMAYNAGSSSYDGSGAELPMPDQEAMKAQYMDTWQP